MEREVGGGIGMGNTCKSMADSCQCMTETTTILSGIGLQLVKINEKKKKEKKLKDHSHTDSMSQKEFKTPTWSFNKYLRASPSNYTSLRNIGPPWWLSGKESTCQFRRCGFDSLGQEYPLE